MVTFSASSALGVTVDAACVWRIVRFVTKDALAEPLRKWAHGRGWRSNGSETAGRATARKFSYFLTCAWCTSIWIAAGVVLLTEYAWTAWRPVALVLAFSAVAGFMGDRS